MLTYEDITGNLLDAAEELDLNIFRVENFVETVSCDKEFHLACTLEEEPPFQVYAELTVFWDSPLTSITVHGGECVYFHDQHTPCMHGTAPITPLPELEIKYVFPVKKVDQLAHLAQQVQSVVSAAAGREYFTNVRFEVNVAFNGEVDVTNAYALYVIEFDINRDELEFQPIVSDVRRVLSALSQVDWQNV